MKGKKIERLRWNEKLYKFALVQVKDRLNADGLNVISVRRFECLNVAILLSLAVTKKLICERKIQIKMRENYNVLIMNFMNRIREGEFCHLHFYVVIILLPLSLSLSVFLFLCVCILAEAIIIRPLQRAGVQTNAAI